jgi:uncharacterized protein (DUF4415 family)
MIFMGGEMRYGVVLVLVYVGRGRPPIAVKRPTLNMRVDAEVLEAFKATGPGWQTRINSLLREAVKSVAVRS